MHADKTNNVNSISTEMQERENEIVCNLWLQQHNYSNTAHISLSEEIHPTFETAIIHRVVFVILTQILSKFLFWFLIIKFSSSTNLLLNNSFQADIWTHDLMDIRMSTTTLTVVCLDYLSSHQTAAIIWTSVDSAIMVRVKYVWIDTPFDGLNFFLSLGNLHSF